MLRHFKNDSHDSAIEALMGTRYYSDDDAIVDSNGEQCAIAHYILNDGHIAGYRLSLNATVSQASELAKLFKQIIK